VVDTGQETKPFLHGLRFPAFAHGRNERRTGDRIERLSLETAARARATQVDFRFSPLVAIRDDPDTTTTGPRKRPTNNQADLSCVVGVVV